MLVGHLICGVVVGALAALAGVLGGYSFWAAVGFYVIGANAGIGASALVALARGRPRGAQVRAVGCSPAPQLEGMPVAE